MTLLLHSPVFKHETEIPRTYTCEGKNVSPPLEWDGIRAPAKSLVLIVDDPDAPDPAAPTQTWVHWVLYNLPVTITSLAEGISPDALPKGTLQGLNDWKKTGYGGPCPPIGKHRYFHKLYALDVILKDLGKPTKAQLEAAMAGHIVAEAQLIGVYQKHGNHHQRHEKK